MEIKMKGDNVDKTKLSHAQMLRMVELTRGYAQRDFDFWISPRRIIYLYIHDIVYNIDEVGGYIARRKSDGELISGGNVFFQTVKEEENIARNEKGIILP
jgi:hypothetical protein